MECHGRYIISMAFQWNYVASRWNAMEFHGRYFISMAFQWNYMASRWNAMECHGMPWTLHYFHGISVKFHGISVRGSKQWKSMEFGQQNGCQQKIPEIFYISGGGGGHHFHGVEYLIGHEVVFCFISSLN